LLDTNVFIAAAKRGWTRTTDLVLRLVDGEEDLIANEALIGEYRKYASELGDYGQLLAGGILISNDRHFDKIKEARIIEVWTISEAIVKKL